jgi:D-alanine-D-alanine ligase
LVKKLGAPFFVKPANAGSSVGISKVKNEQEFVVALKDALQYDFKIVIEEFIDGREIECAVLGNENPVATVPGEIISTHEFYSYTAKYLDENGAKLRMPADLPAATVVRIQKLALKTFKALACEDLGRVDFFLRKKDGAIFVNEINTIPGFTAISMYPKLWEIAGVSYAELVDRLIQSACARFAREQQLKTSYR